MSFAEDLRRNRAVWRRLTGAPESARQGGEAWPEPPAAPEPAVIRRESETLPEAVFQENLRRARADWSEALPTLAEAPEGEGTMPVNRPRRYSLGETAAVEPAAAAAPAPTVELVSGEYPEPAAERTAAEGDDLLEQLLRRMEAGARRYPQELGEEAQGW